MNHTNRLETLANAIVPEAIEWVNELRTYRTYQGKDLEYFRKARIGVGVISTAGRLLATIENARSIDLAISQSRVSRNQGELKEQTPLALNS